MVKVVSGDEANRVVYTVDDEYPTHRLPLPLRLKAIPFYHQPNLGKCARDSLIASSG